jgi:hypothetical protein
MSHRALVTESLNTVECVLRESVKNSERRVDLKGRLVQRNTEERIRFNLLRNGQDIQSIATA